MRSMLDLVSYQIYRGGAIPAPPDHPGYMYLLSGNGLFIAARNQFAAVLQPVAQLRVNGLPQLQPYLHLRYKRLPVAIMEQQVQHGRRYLDREVVYQVVMEDGRLRSRVVAYGTRASAEFTDSAPAASILFEAHTHNTMDAFWSGTDNAYEQHFRFYAVYGRLQDRIAQVRFRLGIYGHFVPLPVSSLFSGSGQEFADRWEDINADQYRETL